MTRFKQHLWLLGLFLALKALGTNTNMPKINPPTAGPINLHISSATANVGDIVPIDFKVGNFNNIDFFTIQVNWNTSYLEFQGITNINLGTADITNFDLRNTATGKFVFSWSSFTPETLSDSTRIFRANFRVKSYTGVPVSIFVPFAAATQPVRSQVLINSFPGFVNINNNGTCSGRAPGLNCLDAPLLCPGDFPYCNTLPVANIPFASGGCGSIENAHLFYFDAGSPTIQFRIEAKRCNGGPPPSTGNGLQVRVYETTDCITFRTVYCGASDAIASGFIGLVDVGLSTPLVVGKRYILMMDGQRNDVCDYVIEIVSGSVGGIPIVSPSEIIGASTSCPNQTGLDYAVNNRIDAIAYEWRVDGGGTIASGQGTNAIKVNWGATAGNVCVKILGTCGQSGFVCKPVGLSPSVVKDTIKTVCPGGSVTIGGQVFNATGNYSVILPNASYTGCDSTINLSLTVLSATAFTSNISRTVCPGGSVTIGTQTFTTTGNHVAILRNGSYTGCDSTVNLNLTVLIEATFTSNISRTVCPGGSVTIGTQTFNTTGNHRARLVNGSFTGCDSIVNLNLTVLNAAALTKTIDSTICIGSSVKIGTQTFTTAGNYTIPFLNGSYTGCDSTVKLNLTVIDISPSATKSGDLSCEIKTVTLTGSATVSPNTATLRYEWKNATGTVIGTTPSVSVNQAGTFTLIVRATSGVTCEKSTTVTVTRSGIVPNRPELRGDVVTCENRAVSYSIANSATGILQYNWTIQGGVINTGAGMTAVSVTWGTNSVGKICVNAENGCGTSDSTCLDVAIGKIPANLAVTGSGNVCPASTATYSAPVSAVTTNYQWTVPTGASIIRGQGTSQIDVNWGISTGGQVCMTPNNSCGSAQQSCFNVVVANTPPDSIPLMGLKTICPGAVDTLKAMPDAAIIKYAWRVSANVTVLSGQNTPTLIVRYNSGVDALIILDIENACNLRRSETHYVTIVSELPPALPILGNTAVCSNDTTSYGVSGNASISAYKWSVPQGATIVSGQGSQTIRVAWDTVTVGQICLELTATNCGLKRTVCTDIKVKNAAVDTFTIMGAAQACPGTVVTYTVTPNPKFKTFNWIVPTNGTINKGQGTHEIEIKWNTVGVGDVCLDITNDCNAKRSKCLNVTIKTGIDSLTITGVREVCEGTTATFTVQKDPDAVSYLWGVPTGATIETGRATNQITVRFGNTGGRVVVQPIGGCAENPSSINVTLKNAPIAPATITGAANVCQGETVTYKASAVSGILGYKWQVPTGALIVGSDSTDEVKVRWVAATGGRLTVKTRNECRESLEKTADVSVNRLPQPKAGADDSTCGKQYILRGGISIGTPVWRVIEKPTAASFTFSDTTKENSTITVTQTGKYVLTFSERNNQCVATDTVVLLFRTNPQLTLIDNNCNSDGSKFTLNAVITGTAPFTISSGVAGTITGNIFTANPLADGASYSLTLKDAFGCESNTLTGVKKCPCITQAAVLKNAPIAVCFGQKGKVEVVRNGVLDANDTFEYVLHDSSTTSVGNVLQSNKTGEFAFDATKMQFDRTYYIQYRVGNNDGGTVITTDRCYGASNSIPIVFRSKTTVSLKGDTVICANSEAVLTFKTNATEAFNITLKNIKENSVVTLNNIRNNKNIPVTPSVSTVYALIDVIDQKGCAVEIGDSAKVTIRAKLFGEAGIDQTVCVKTAQLAAVVPPQYQINWRSVSGADIASKTNPTTTVSNLKNGKNSFILTTSDSICSGYRSFDTVSIFMPIVPKALDLSLEMFMGDTLVSGLSEGAPVGTYSVTRLTNPANGRFDVFNNGTFNYISDPKYAGIAKFTFIVCSDACTGICDTGEVRILIQPKPIKVVPIEINVPNAITPNDDGKNDVLMIDNIEKFPEAELTIFNRWGDILFIAKNYNNTWNGTNQRGDPLPEGTYYYILRLKLNDGKILRGDMTILR